MSAKIFTYADADRLAHGVAQRWLTLAAACIREQGYFNVALTGGTTPRHLYETLADAAHDNRLAWEHVHVYFGDERCVAPDHADSNYGMAKDALLSHVPLVEAHIHRIHAEDANARRAANAYTQELHKHLPKHEDLPYFDLMLLGLGADGHTASLFPGTPIVDETEQFVSAVYVEKLSTWRISLTFPVINNARHIWWLVAGENKAWAVQRVLVLEESPAVPLLPAQRVVTSERVEWHIDSAAAQSLK